MRKSRLIPALVFGGVTSAVLGALFLVSDHLGRRASPASLFLVSFRAPTFDEVQLAAAGEHALFATENNDVVFVGDSSCRHGIDPKQFEALTGLTSYNLGVTVFGGADGTLVIAMAYLATHPKPQVLVLCVAPPTFTYDVRYHAEVGPTEKRFVTAYGSRVPGLPPQVLPDQVRLGFCQIGSSELWRILCRRPDDLSRPIGGSTDTYRSFAKRLAQSRGYLRLDGHRPERAKEPISIAVDGPDASWQRCLTVLAQYCQVRGIKFVIRMGPLEKTLIHQRNLDPVLAWLASLTRDYSCLTVARPELLWYDASLCWDTHHLNVQGVEKFMPLVARDVRAVIRN